MRINNITIKNFRGFENKSFHFDPRMNVVLGDNTTGKTTLLHAVQIALGAYLKLLTIVDGCSRNFKKSDYVKVLSKAGKSSLSSDNKPEIAIETSVVEERYDTHAYKRSYSYSNKITWTRVGGKAAQKYTEQLNEFVNNIEHFRREADELGEISVMPLMLSFGASRLQNNYNGKKKTQKRVTREEKAYKDSLSDEKVDFKSVFNWIYRYEKNLEKDLEFAKTDIAFENALKKAIPAIKQIEINRKDNELNTEIQMTKDPVAHWLTYDMMSDGFKSMINIVAEIAYRCIMLNGFLGINAVKDTPGIVMIDEIELYLHPHWQQHILQDLQNAFPKIQFIVTSHSPFIVQSVESQNVIALDKKDITNTSSPKNRGIEEISANEMGMENGLKSLKYKQQLELAEKYFQLVKEGREGRQEIDKVKKELNDLELKFSLINDPAYEAFLRINRGNL